MTHAEQISRWGGLLSMLVLVHFVVDWVFQTHAEAMAKHNNARVRARHCAIYTVGFGPILIYLGFRQWDLAAAMAILFFSHFVEDTYWPVVLWAKYVRSPPEMQWRVKWYSHSSFSSPEQLRAGQGKVIERPDKLMLIPPPNWPASGPDPLKREGVLNAASAKRLMALDFVKGAGDIRRGQRELDRIGFIEFVGDALGKILMIAIDQIVHVCFLVPIVWMTPP